LCDNADLPEEGGFVRVTGISSCEESDSDVVSVVRVRKESDILLLEPPGY